MPRARKPVKPPTSPKESATRMISQDLRIDYGHSRLDEADVLRDVFARIERVLSRRAEAARARRLAVA